MTKLTENTPDDPRKSETEGGPIMTRRGAIKLSVGGGITVALSRISGVTAASLVAASAVAPVQAQAQEIGRGGDLAVIPACTIRVRRQLAIKDAEKSLDNGFWMSNYNAKSFEDDLNLGRVKNPSGGVGYDWERGGKWFWNDGTNTQTVNMRSWRCNQNYSGSDPDWGFTLLWRNAACDADGDNCDVLMFFHGWNTWVRGGGWAGWYNELQNQGFDGMPVVSTFDFEINGEKILIPSFESIGGVDTEAVVDIRFFKSSAKVACWKYSFYTSSNKAKGTFVCFCDDLDSIPYSRPGGTRGNAGKNEFFATEEGADGYYTRPDTTIRAYNTGGSTRFEATDNRDTNVAFQTLKNGLAIATTPTARGNFKLKNGGDCFRSQFFDQRWYPLTLRAFPIAKHKDWPVAPNLYRLDLKANANYRLTVEPLEKGGDVMSGSQLHAKSSCDDAHKIYWVVTPFYEAGDRAEKGLASFEGGYRVCPLIAVGDDIDYCGFKSCKAVAPINYSNRSLYQKILLTQNTAKNAWLIKMPYDGDQFLSVDKSLKNTSCAWERTSSGGRAYEWKLTEPFAAPSDWAPDKLQCLFNVYTSGGTLVGTFTTDENGYAAQVDTSCFGHNLPPGRYYFKLVYASWTNQSGVNAPLINAVANGDTWGHKHQFKVQASPYPNNWLRTAIPIGRRSVRLSKTLRKASGVTVPDGNYMIKPASGTGFPLDSSGGTDYWRSGQGVTLWTAKSGTDAKRCQVWNVRNCNGYVLLSPVKNMLLRLNRYEDSNTNETTVVTYTHDGSSAERWVLKASSVAKGAFRICSNTDSDWALAVTGTVGNGAGVGLRRDDGSKSQAWYFTPMGVKNDFTEMDPSKIPGDPSSTMSGWKYGLFADEACTDQVATFNSESTPRDPFGKEYQLHVGRRYYLREVAGGDGCQLDQRVYMVSAPTCGSGELWIDVTNLPIESVKVHFLLVDKDETAKEVYSTFFTYGATLATSAGMFKTAESYFKGFFKVWNGSAEVGIESTDCVQRWYTATDFKTKFTSQAATKDIFLYARCPVGQVMFYADGADDSHKVWTSATYYLGTRYTIGDDQKKAAKRSGTVFGGEGWDGWYTSETDEGWIAQAPGKGGVSKLGATSFIIDKTIVKLYSVNRVTVNFNLVDYQNARHEQYRYVTRWGWTVGTADTDFKKAEDCIKPFYGVETAEYVNRWFAGEWNKVPSRSVFKNDSKRFTSQTAGGDIHLYAECPTGQVIYYADGTDDAHIVRVDGAKADYKNIYAGTRYVIPAGVSAAAARADCTPGWDGWFSDSSDKAFTEDTAGQGGSSRSAADFILKEEVVRLYSVNRATVSFAYVDDSPELEEFSGSCHTEPDVAAAFADVSMPVAAVHRCDVSRRLPSRETAFAEQEDGRWRTYSPRFWYATHDGSGATSSSIKMVSDAARYIEWAALTRDGVVDERG